MTIVPVDLKAKNRGLKREFGLALAAALVPLAK
jgi:hypothetical protein